MRENEKMESEKISNKIKEYEKLAEDLKNVSENASDRQTSGIRLMQSIIYKLDEDAKNS